MSSPPSSPGWYSRRCSATSKLNGVDAPTVLVMEEAHTFISATRRTSRTTTRRASAARSSNASPVKDRKFGLGLCCRRSARRSCRPRCFRSATPSCCTESATTATRSLCTGSSQTIFAGLLRELPSLPSQSAILLGWASELPVLVKMNDLPKSQQPRSDDPDFWGVWIGKDDKRQTSLAEHRLAPNRRRLAVARRPRTVGEQQ